MPDSFVLWLPRPATPSPVLQIHGLAVRERMNPCLVDRPGGTGDRLLMCFADPVLIAAQGRREWHTPPVAMLWDEGHGHCYGSPSGSWRHSWLHCCGTLPTELLHQAALPLGSPLPLASLERIDLALRRLHEELLQSPRPDDTLVHLLFHCFLRELVRAAHPTDSPAVPPALAEVKQYLDDHFTHTVTLAALARRAHFSVPHFCAQFRRHYGVSALEYVIRRRLQLAAYHLRDHNLRVAEVAERVGYPDLAYFSRLFRRRYGQSPRQYRQDGPAGP